MTDVRCTYNDCRNRIRDTRDLPVCRHCVAELESSARQARQDAARGESFMRRRLSALVAENEDLNTEAAELRERLAQATRDIGELRAALAPSTHPEN